MECIEVGDYLKSAKPLSAETKSAFSFEDALAFVGAADLALA